jgi:hypothetical protein
VSINPIVRLHREQLNPRNESLVGVEDNSEGIVPESDNAGFSSLGQIVF